MLQFLYNRLLKNCKHAQLHTTNFAKHQSSSFNHQLGICVCICCNSSIFGSHNYQHQSSIVHLCMYVHVMHFLHYWLPIIAKWHTSNLMSSQPWKRMIASFRMSSPVQKNLYFASQSVFCPHVLHRLNKKTNTLD